MISLAEAKLPLPPFPFHLWQVTSAVSFRPCWAPWLFGRNTNICGSWPISTVCRLISNHFWKWGLTVHPAQPDSQSGVGSLRGDTENLQLWLKRHEVRGWCALGVWAHQRGSLAVCQIVFVCMCVKGGEPNCILGWYLFLFFFIPRTWSSRLSSHSMQYFQYYILYLSTKFLLDSS